MPPTSFRQEVNIFTGFAGVVHFSETDIVSKEEHPVNIFSIVVTLRVSKPERSSEVNLIHPPNIFRIIVTFLVLKELRSIESILIS